MLKFLKKTFTKENMKKFGKFFFSSFIWLGVLLLVIDIVSKWTVVNYFGKEAMYRAGGIRDYDKMIPIIPHFLYIGGSINPYAAFSFQISKDFLTNRIIFICISAIMAVIFSIYYAKEYKKLNGWTKAAIIVLISGAVGNLIDRAFYWESTVGFSGVIDWIQVVFFYGKANESMFAMFNIADSCIVVSVILFIVMIIIDTVKDTIEAGKRGEFKYSPDELKENERDKDNK